MSQVGYSPQGIISSITQERYSPQSVSTSSTQGEFSPQEAVSAQTQNSESPQKAVSSQPQAGDASEQGGEDGLAEQTQKMEQLMQRFLHPRLRSTRALERFRNEVRHSYQDLLRPLSYFLSCSQKSRQIVRVLHFDLVLRFRHCENSAAIYLNVTCFTHVFLHRVIWTVLASVAAVHEDQYKPRGLQRGATES